QSSSEKKGRKSADIPPMQSRRRTPRTAAVTITGVKEDFPYAEALKDARTKINLKDIGIEISKVRRALNGGFLIEVPGGEEATSKANQLAMKLREVLKETARVACPTKKGEIRISGLDDSISKDEVACALADIGGCLPTEIRIGNIRCAASGLGTAWTQLPLAAALKASEAVRMKVGWTVARLELLENRPLQCYRCWEFGHIGNTCKSETSRAGSCYNCGKPDHLARDC
ncbi:hypothetical protein EAI_04932, partial [Harpegnathos saltator]